MKPYRFIVCILMLLAMSPAFSQEAVPVDVSDVPDKMPKRKTKLLKKTLVPRKDLDPAVLREIDEHFKNLGSAQFRKRRKASRRLVALATIRKTLTADKTEAKKTDTASSTKPSWLGVGAIRLVEVESDDLGDAGLLVWKVQLGAGEAETFLELKEFFEVIKPFPYFWVVVGQAETLASHTDPEVAIRARDVVTQCKNKLAAHNKAKLVIPPNDGRW